MNPPWTVLIADDEPLGRRRMVLALEQVEGVALVAQARDGASAKAMIDELSPDIALLDIQMPGLSGLEVCAGAAEGPAHRAFVFVTAHEQFAREAFDVAAVDYLLKPFSIDRFKQALARAMRHCEQARIEAQRLAKAPAPPALGEIWVSDRRGKRRVSVTDIDWIGAERDYSRIYIGAEGLLHNEPLGRIEARLQPRMFLRVHRSALVRVDAVRKILRGARGQTQLVTGATVLAPVGRRYAPKIRHALQGGETDEPVLAVAEHDR